MKNFALDDRLYSGKDGGIGSIGGSSDYTKEQIMKEVKKSEVGNVVENGGDFRDAVIVYVGSEYENASDEELSQFLKDFPEIEVDIIQGMSGNESNVGTKEWLDDFVKKN